MLETQPEQLTYINELGAKILEIPIIGDWIQDPGFRKFLATANAEQLYPFLNIAYQTAIFTALGFLTKATIVNSINLQDFISGKSKKLKIQPDIATFFINGIAGTFTLLKNDLVPILNTISGYGVEALINELFLHYPNLTSANIEKFLSNLFISFDLNQLRNSPNKGEFLASSFITKIDRPATLAIAITILIEEIMLVKILIDLSKSPYLDDKKRIKAINETLKDIIMIPFKTALFSIIGIIPIEAFKLGWKMGDKKEIDPYK